GQTQRLAFFSASLATAAAVSLAGPIGFVGIVVPHLVRLMVGVDHRIVLPASALFGAAFLIGCDLVARTVLAPVEVPVGVVTAMVGGPFFLWLLVRRSWFASLGAFFFWAARPLLGGARTCSVRGQLAIKPRRGRPRAADQLVVSSRSSRTSPGCCLPGAA